MRTVTLYDSNGRPISVNADALSPVGRPGKGFSLAKTAANTTGVRGSIPMNDGYAQYSNAVVNQDNVWEALFTESGQRAVGAQMAVPIRKELDYQGQARKFFEIDVLAQGQIARYDKDIDTPSYVVAKRATVAEYLIEGEYVEPSTWEIFSPASIRLSEIQKRRFNVLDRAQERIRIATNLQEDDEFLFLAATSAAANTANNPITTSTSGCDKDFLNELTATISVRDIPVYALFMSFDSYKDIRGWDNSEVDPVTMREILQTGLYGQLWGIDIIVSRRVAVGTVYCFAEPRFFGVMPIRTEFIVMPDDQPRAAQIGFIGYEELGLSIVNANGLAKGTHS
jgi:hypothetical protein